MSCYVPLKSIEDAPSPDKAFCKMCLHAAHFTGTVPLNDNPADYQFGQMTFGGFNMVTTPLHPAAINAVTAPNNDRFMYLFELKCCQSRICAPCLLGWLRPMNYRVTDAPCPFNGDLGCGDCTHPAGLKIDRMGKLYTHMCSNHFCRTRVLCDHDLVHAAMNNGGQHLYKIMPDMPDLALALNSHGAHKLPGSKCEHIERAPAAVRAQCSYGQLLGNLFFCTPTCRNTLYNMYTDPANTVPTTFPPLPVNNGPINLGSGMTATVDSNAPTAPSSPSLLANEVD